MRKLLLTCLLLSACILPLDDWFGTTPEDLGYYPSETIYAVANQSKAMILLQMAVREEYPDVNLSNRHHEEVRVWWFDSRCPADPSRYAVVGARDYRGIQKGRCYGGITFARQLVFVALSNLDKDRLCGSAFLHEYGHVIHDDVGGDGDPDHSDERFWGVVSKVNEDICSRGW